MCFYLQSDVWQDRTETLITELGTTSARVLRQSNDALLSHAQLALNQEKSLRNEADMLQREAEILALMEQARTNLTGYTSDVQGTLGRMQEWLAHEGQTLQSQADTVVALVDKVYWIQQHVGGCVSSLQAIAYHLAALVAVWALTLLHEARGARFKLVFVVGAHYALESAVQVCLGAFVHAGAVAPGFPAALAKLSGAPADEPSLLATALGFVRTAALPASCLFVLVRELLAYCDYDKVCFAGVVFAWRACPVSCAHAPTTCTRRKTTGCL
jgi:hypothetical protein